MAILRVLRMVFVQKEQGQPQGEDCIYERIANTFGNCSAQASRQTIALCSRAATATQSDSAVSVEVVSPIVYEQTTQHNQKNEIIYSGYRACIALCDCTRNRAELASLLLKQKLF